MESTRDALLEAGLELLGTRGARAATARAAEDLAGVPHGTMRHHFGGQDGYLAALTQRLLDLDAPRPDEAPADTIERWLTADRTLTRARYELTLLAVREPRIGAIVAAGRDTYVASLTDLGLPAATARLAVACFDGVVLDGLLRGDTGADITPLLRAFDG